MGMLLELVAELPEAEAQQLGGAGLNTPRGLEGHLDVALLHPIEDVVEMMAQRASQKGLEVACHIQPNLPSLLRGDPDRLRFGARGRLPG